MPKKLLLFLTGLLFLAGCGASSEPTVASCSVDSAVPEGDTVIVSSRAPTQKSNETAPVAAYDGSCTNYFHVNRDTAISTDDDGTELLYEYSCQTDFSAENRELDLWVDSVLEQIQKEYTSNSENLLEYARESLNIQGKEFFYSFSNYQEIGIARHDCSYASLVVLSSVYSGGAHPNSVQTAWNLDLVNRKVLRLEDVLYPDCGSTLAALVLQQVEEKFLSLGENALNPDYADHIAEAFQEDAMTPYWYLNQDGLVIFFNQYELGPYAAGIIKAQIPYEQLQGILREAYFPGNPGNVEVSGDLLLRGDWEGYRKIPITIESNGERLLIGVEGQVFQIRLSEVFWLENTAIGQKVLFSTNHLRQNDVLELTGGYDDESRSFALEFMDAQGNRTIYYIHPDGLSEQP